MRLTKFFFLFTLVFFSISGISNASFQKNGNMILKVNNSYLIYSSQTMPTVIDNRVYISLRSLVDFMGGNLQFEKGTQKVSISIDKKKLTFDLKELKGNLGIKQFKIDRSNLVKQNGVIVNSKVHQIAAEKCTTFIQEIFSL